jgi:hypothetical protein
MDSLCMYMPAPAYALWNRQDKLFDKGYFIMSGDVKLLVLYFDTKHVKKVRTGHAEQLHR